MSKQFYVRISFATDQIYYKYIKYIYSLFARMIYIFALGCARGDASGAEGLLRLLQAIQEDSFAYVCYGV